MIIERTASTPMVATSPIPADIFADPPVLHARIRILQTAGRLFALGGSHNIGVDRIIAETRVTKATLYKYFPSKDALIVGYLRESDQQIREAISQLILDHDTPAAGLRALVDRVAAESVREGFTGCPFINVTAQFGDPKHPARAAVAEHRAWYARTVQNLFRGSGHPRAEEATAEYLVARDGLFCSANLGNPEAARIAFLHLVGRVISEAE